MLGCMGKLGAYGVKEFRRLRLERRVSWNHYSSAARLIHEPDADRSRPGYRQGNKIEFQLIPASVGFNPVSHLHGSLFDADWHVSKEVPCKHPRPMAFGAESLGFRTRRHSGYYIGSK